MVCVHCGKDTRVINSRLQKRRNQVWRRRQCVSCQSVFTTEETVNYGTAWTVKGKTGSYEPFAPSKLLLSLHRSLRHRPAALSDAEELSQTIVRRLGPRSVDGCIEIGTITDVAQVALSRFDKAASVHYGAYHRAG